MAAVARRRRVAPDWNALTEVALPTLRSADPDALRAGSRHDGVVFGDAVFGDVSADEAIFLECRLSECAVGDGRLRRARLSSCVLEDVRATTLDLSDSRWTDVVIRRSRLGALVAHG